jgi:peptide/nickel transport system ATP-binding protein
MSTLIVDQLQTRIDGRHGGVLPVDQVSFSVAAGQIMGLVGESGSGKSMTGYSIMGLLDPPAHVCGGRILFNGTDLRTLSREQMRRLRGDRIAMIFQDPMMTLNPVLRIDTQMIEALQAHHRIGRAAARERCLEVLAQVGMAAPEQRLLAYPYQLSGGMRQRVAIAIALLNRPDLIICDEPTTALDVTIQGQILHQMQALCREAGTALIWITHDLSVVAGLADQVCVMYAGRIVESGSTAQVLEAPRHPYTRGLIASAPSRNPCGQPLQQIPGMAPALDALPRGCAFQPRCAQASARCLEPPPMRLDALGALRCHHPAAAAGLA